jgi:hypothetical protein
MRYAVELENPNTGERQAVVVSLTPEQQQIADGPHVARPCVINAFALKNASEAAPPGFRWDGGAIQPVN